MNSAMAVAASFPEGISAQHNMLNIVSWSPSRRFAVLSPTVAARLLTVRISLGEEFSMARMAVMILVMEAIFKGSCAPRSK